MSYALSQIDLQHFGIVTAKAFVSNSLAWRDVHARARRDGVKLLMLRIPAEHLELAREVQHENAELMDVLCYFEHGLTESSDFITDCPLGGLLIRRAKEQDVMPAREVVRSIFFEYPNHYRNDPRLDRHDVDEVYPSWAETIIKSAEACVLLAENEGKPVGISAVVPVDTGGFDVALFGIHPDLAGQGLGDVLLRRSMQWTWTHGGTRLTYSTQLSNLPARRMLTRHGFLPTHDVLTFHLWL
ncbi:MAG TPA: GNAT family N-acetyltransferase [Methylococcaceae bacterium]|nr:GNAT family N-acetyltransferase [Methylococcaceae bacterium]